MSQASLRSLHRLPERRISFFGVIYYVTVWDEVLSPLTEWRVMVLGPFRYVSIRQLDKLVLVDAPCCTRLSAPLRGS